MQSAELWCQTFNIVTGGDADKVQARLRSWLGLYRAATGEAYPWDFLNRLVELKVVHVLPVWQHPDFDIYTNYFRGLFGVEPMLADPLAPFDAVANPVAAYYVNPEDVLDDTGSCPDLGEPSVLYESGSPLEARLKKAGDASSNGVDAGQLKNWLVGELEAQGRQDLAGAMRPIHIGE